jgi:hypothetical protein
MIYSETSLSEDISCDHRQIRKKKSFIALSVRWEHPTARKILILQMMNYQPILPPIELVDKGVKNWTKKGRFCFISTAIGI